MRDQGALTRRVEGLLAAAARNSSIVFAAAIALLAAGVLLVTRVSFDANILRLLPRDSPAVQSFQTFLQHFGSLDHLYIVFESAEPIGEHADLVSAYVDGLRRSPEVESVDAELFGPDKDWSYLFDRELLLLGPDGTKEALSRLSGPGLDRELAHARDLLSMPSSDVKALVQQDPLGLLSLLRERMSREEGLTAFDPTQTGYVSPDGRSRLVIVKPKGAPFDSDFCKALFRRLDEIERASRAAVAPDDATAATVTIQAAGGYRVSLEAERLIRRESIVNTVGSLVLLLAIVFALFRTPWIMVYGTLPIAIGALTALGLAGLMQGALSPAISGTAGLLFGLAIDGIIVMYVRFLDERANGRTPADAIRGMAGTAASVILAQATTAATFFALLVVDFPTLQDLGRLVGVGILISCAVTIVLLPAMLSRHSAPTSVRPLRAAWLGRWVTRSTRPIVVTAMVVTIALGAVARGIHLDTRIDTLQARTAGSAIEEELAKRFSLPKDLLLVIDRGPDVDPLIERAGRVRDALDRRGERVAVSSAAFLLPSRSVQQRVADIVRASGIRASDVARDVTAAATRAGFRADAFALFLARLPALLDVDQRITYDALVSHGLASIVSHFIARDGDAYLTAVYLSPKGPADLPGLAGAVHQVDPALQITGLPAVNEELARTFMPTFAKGLAIGVMAVALIIYAAFRSWRYTLLAFVSTVTGFTWSLGILTLFHVTLDLFSLFAAVTFVGIAVDYDIYVISRYRESDTRDMADVLTRTGAAIMIACLTALVGFGTLMNSSYGPLHLFGIVSVVTLSCCLVTSLVVLPAIVIELSRLIRPANAQRF